MSNDIISSEILKIIETSRNNAYRKVNEELINMYWNVGKYLCGVSEEASFGDSYIDKISEVQTTNNIADVYAKQVASKFNDMLSKH